VVFAAIFLQIGLGLSHHLIFMRSGTPTVLGKIHRFLGISILVLGIVNGGLGLDFAGSSTVAYSVVVAIMAVIFLAASVYIHHYNRRHVYKPEEESMAKRSYADDPPDEYEMHQTPFASTTGDLGHVQTPRTPFFGTGQARYGDDSGDFRAYQARGDVKGALEGPDSIYTDTPASDRENPFKAKWESVPLR
jgi:hypothetical protein